MRKLYLSSLLLVLSWLVAPVGWAQDFTAGFDTAPDYSCSTSGNTRQPNCFQVTLNGVVYVFAFTTDGGGGSFLHINTGGVGNGPSMDLLSTNFDVTTGEKVTITRLDGGTFAFSSIYVDHLENATVAKEPVTVRPFLLGAPAAASQTVLEGGKQTLTFNGVITSSVEITCDDFYYISLDNFSVCVPPSVSFNAAGLCLGAPTNFTNTATQVLPGATYQWDFNNDNVVDATSPNASFTYPAAGTYTAKLTIKQGGCVSSAEKQVTISARPTAVLSGGGTVCAGTSSTLSIALTGTPPWSVTYTDGTMPVTQSNVQTSPYVFSVTPASSKTYSLTAVANATCAGTVSGSAPVTVNTPPAIGTQPAGATKCVGESVAFGVTATGSGLTYQWKKNGNNIPGATGTSYSIPSVATGDAGTYTVQVTGTCGTPLVSGGAVLNVNQPPSITSQPESATVCQGGSASFTITASNAASYQWQVNTGSGFVNVANGSIYSGATTPTLQLNGLTPAMNGYQYRLVATSSCPPSVISNVVTLGVNSQTLITTGPTGGTVCVGDPFTLGVSATGTGLSYQWKKNGSDIPGATGSTYSIPSVATGDAGTYTVQVTGTCGTPQVSGGAVLNVNQPPSITSQPEDVTVCQGGSTTFSVTAGNATGYQWQMSMGSGFVNLNNNGMFSGANSPTLTITGAPTYLDGVQYRVLVTGSCPPVTSSAATLRVSYLILVREAPEWTTKCVGEPAAFSVAAEGSSVSYQWKKDGNDIPGATNSTYSIASVSLADAGMYSVAVSGSCGAPVLTEGAMLTVNVPPTLTGQPANVAICTGQNASFAVTASDATDYQWQVNTGSGFADIANSAIYSGATTATLNITGATAGLDGYQYRLVVTGACPPIVTSDVATLTVNTPPVITAGPIGATKCVGEQATFSVTATGTDLVYQWKKNGTNIEGATSSTFSIGSASVGDAGSYTVQVSGVCSASVASAPAVLVVNQVPALISQPAGEEVCAGGNASFSVTASNATSYQWQVNAGSGFVNVVNGEGYSGATTATLTVTGATAGMNGYQYRAVVTGACPPVLTSNAATLTVGTPVTIIRVNMLRGVCAGGPIDFNVEATGTGLTYQWKKDGNVIPGATGSSFTIPETTIDDSGFYTVTVSGTCGAPVTSGSVPVQYEVPATITSQPAPVAICAGSNASFTVGASNATGYQWQVNTGSGFVSLANNAVYSGVNSPTLLITAATTALNGYEYRAVASGACPTLAISNGAKLSVGSSTALGTFTPLAAPVLVGTPVAMTIGFTGDAPSPAVWHWGDGTTSNATVVGSTLTGTHVYTTQNVYTPSITVTSCGVTATQAYQYVVVYDPSGGFITGSGWFNSPAGAYRPQPSLEGRVNFGFVSKYKKGTTVPDGSTQFQYRMGNLSFRSTAYEWLVISGAKGQFKGSGTINGTGNYGFILTAIDGGKRPDRLRMKIWNKANNAVVYDNQFGAGDTADPTTVINGGSIMIKAPSKSAREGVDVAETAALPGNPLRAYPNPFVGEVVVDLSGFAPGKVRLDITSQHGRSVHRQDVQVAQNQSSVRLNLAELPSGLYLLQAKGRDGQQWTKLIKR
jgi:predicted secreted protein